MVFFVTPLARFRELLLPYIVELLLVKIWKDEVEDIGVPFRGPTFDALFDVLSSH
jgi:hypothetical protein